MCSEIYGFNSKFNEETLTGHKVVEKVPLERKTDYNIIYFKKQIIIYLV